MTIHCGQSFIEVLVDKETIYIPEEKSFPCPDDSHPLFTINATKRRPGICYYCSKMFIVDKNKWSLEFFKGRAG